MMRRTTVLGFDERVERVLAYAFLWISGVLLFMVETRPTESSRNVRWHAAQSILTFGTLSLLILGVSLLKGMLGWIPLLGLLTNFGLGLLLNVLWWTTGILWVWLMVMAWVHPRYRLPLVDEWMRYFI
ncbi:MAG: hypothetical protein NVSMB49_25360 [Ktedonobacteraceae bacterium]